MFLLWCMYLDAGYCTVLTEGLWFWVFVQNAAMFQGLTSDNMCCFHHLSQALLSFLKSSKEHLDVDLQNILKVAEKLLSSSANKNDSSGAPGWRPELSELSVQLDFGSGQNGSWD